MDSDSSEILPLPHGPARIEWRRSARARRVSLRIDPREGAVVVTLPPRAGRKAGMALLMDHAAWVSARLAELPGAVAFRDGARVPLHGREVTIRHVASARGTVWAEGDWLLVAGSAEFLSRRVADFFRAEARRSFLALAQAKAAAAELRFRRLTVKDTRSRWGSCASNGNLAFSWRLVMAPPFVQDYVASHEVAHLRHMHHGPRFWALVDQLTPHTAAAVEWLRGEGPRLLRVG
ncbi:MAG: M48 family metallopeptidase [Acetobacteraceae bacterium]|nr:M48 family metallopeptidase [Acetobacteraceae bacterium]